MTVSVAWAAPVQTGVSLACRLFCGLAKAGLIFTAYFGLIMSFAYFGSDFPSDAQARISLELGALCFFLIIALQARLDRQSRAARHTAAIIGQ
jgi:hypothetical protein